ncbi:MAG: restriction endonuclease subunit R, partial [Symploca sp. SIO1C4]|nr:restriction endonuclease subunit R [Symploca sp. SIO1C4]
LKIGIPQALAYMLAATNPIQPLFGIVTNGSNFLFLKLIRQNHPQYARSHEFVLERGDDFYRVLQILKKLSAAIGS